MLNQPMSSPMMTMMLGLLPPAAGCAWAVALATWATRMLFSSPSMQHVAGSAARAEAARLLLEACAPAWAAAVDQRHGTVPVATPYPSSAPAARKIRAWSLEFLSMYPPFFERKRETVMPLLS